MSVSAFLIIDGVDGPSTSRKKAIDVLSYSFGASNTVVIGSGSSGSESRAGRAELSNLVIMKVLDKTSPELFEHCVTGDFFKKVEMFYDKPIGDKQEDYFKITLEGAVITSLQQSGSSENPSESVSFAFQKVKIGYNPESKDGKLSGFVERGFDQLTLTKY